MINLKNYVSGLNKKTLQLFVLSLMTQCLLVSVLFAQEPGALSAEISSTNIPSEEPEPELAQGDSELSVSSQSSVSKNQIEEDLKVPIKLQDLAYGNILFDYYRGNHFDALNGILVAQKRGLLVFHKQNARLLSGVIYLDLGMLVHAKSIFNELLTQEDLESGLLAKIEYYLGTLHYRQGDYVQAEARLTQVIDSLKPSERDSALIMLGNIAIAQNNKETARSWLNQISIDSELAAASRYNLGILWLIENNYEQAHAELNKLLPSYNDDKVITGLQDKALVALGYYQLSHNKPAEARELLLKVNLNSPLANKAMLGVGWSYSSKDNFAKALVYWNELSKRDIRDIAVQEALLAVPYAYQKQQGLKQALEKYLAASEKFQQQLNLVDELSEKVEQGLLLDKFVTSIASNEFAGLKGEDGLQDSDLFGERYDYYLYELISQHGFNEGFRNYQKLGQLSYIVSRWDDALPTFTDILQANEIRFEEKLPLINSYLEAGSFAKYQAALEGFESDIKNLKTNKKLHLLADPQELRLHKRLSGLKDKISQLPQGKLSAAQLATAQRAHGVFQWQLETGKAGRIWQLEKQVRQIRETVEVMQIRKTALANARVFASSRFIGFKEQVDGASGKLQALKEKIQAQLEAQANALKNQIIGLLAQRRATLNHYLLQSDLAVARLHDESLKIPELD